MTSTEEILFYFIKSTTFIIKETAFNRTSMELKVDAVKNGVQKEINSFNRTSMELKDI